MKSSLTLFLSIKRNIYVAVTLISICLLFFFYGSIICDINSYSLGNNVDGLNCWYSMKYHIHDEGASYTQYKAANYPFSESYNINALPLYTYLFKWYQNNIGETGNLPFSLLYGIIFFFIGITPVIHSSILWRYGVKGITNVLFSLGICYLNPQIHRITTHINLAFCILIPLIWYLYLLFDESPSVLRFLYVVTCIIIFTFIHPYFLPLSLLLIIILITFNSKYQRKQKWLYGLLFITVPVLLFLLINRMCYTGSSDFDKVPYGSFGGAYRSRPEDVFFPNESSLWMNYLNLNWLGRAGWEGEAFIGFASWITAGTYFFFLIKKIRLRKKNRKPYDLLQHGFFVACFILFFFSTGTLHFIIPYKVKEAFPSLITNFRAYGRLSWIIFYVFSIAFTVWYYRWYKLMHLKRKSHFAYVSLCAILIFLSVDIYDNNQRVSETLSKFRYSLNKNEIRVDSLLNGVNTANYQAIVALPYSARNTGQKATRDPDQELLYPLYHLSLKLFLPITNGFSARASISEFQEQYKFYGLGNKRILSHFRSKKKLLIISTTEAMDKIKTHTIDKSELYPFEIQILDQAATLNSSGNWVLMEWDPFLSSTN